MPRPQHPSIDRLTAAKVRIRLEPPVPTLRPLVAVLFSAAIVWTASCSSPSPSRAARVAVDRWLGCEECNEGELAAVLAFGSQVLPPLRQALLTGPDSVKLRRLEDALAQRALRLQDSVPLPSNHPPPHHGQLNADAQRYVDTFLANYTAVVEKRAALAVAKIGGPEAKVALQQAGTLNLRSDVHDFVIYAHDSLWVP